MTVVKLLGLVIGIAIFLGLLMYHAAVLVPRPTPPYSTPPPSSYQSMVLGLGLGSMALLDFAAGLSVSIAWIVAASRSELSDSPRRGIFAFATAFLVAWLVMSSFVVQVLAGLIRYGY